MPAPLSIEQQRLVNIVKTAHSTLAVARKTHQQELQRRLQEARVAAARALQEAEEQVRIDLQYEIVQHEAALDESLIVAINAGIPLLRIAQDGFGNRYPGGVQELVTKLRADGRIGSVEGYQRNTADEFDTQRSVEFPEPLDVSTMLSQATTLVEPQFVALPEPLVLVPADKNGDNEVSVPAVVLTMDPRDPWFKRIDKSAREGTPHRRATTATLYLHPATGVLTAVESKEEGDVIWDHPVARWVKDHRSEATVQFRDALLAADVDA